MVDRYCLLTKKKNKEVSVPVCYDFGLDDGASDMVWPSYIILLPLSFAQISFTQGIPLIHEKKKPECDIGQTPSSRYTVEHS
jgi:hypothetical protein